MPLTEIETRPTNWEEVFKAAHECLSKNQLTAVAFVSEKEYASSSYVATLLEEFAQIMGGIEVVLENLRQMAPDLYSDAKYFRLLHGEMKIAHQVHVGLGWILVIVYSS